MSALGELQCLPGAPLREAETGEHREVPHTMIGPNHLNSAQGDDLGFGGFEGAFEKMDLDQRQAAQHAKDLLTSPLRLLNEPLRERRCLIEPPLTAAHPQSAKLDENGVVARRRELGEPA